MYLKKRYKIVLLVLSILLLFIQSKSQNTYSICILNNEDSHFVINYQIQLSTSNSFTISNAKNFFSPINFIAILAISLTILISLFGFLYYRSKQKFKDQLSFHKMSIDRQQREFKNQKDEWEIQKNLVIHQRDRIINMLTDLGESIDYARKIQQAILPSETFLNNILNDYFLIFHPRESVGGDFYWAAKYDNLICVAVADCTGHGVPGGFMSMLGITMLNDVLMRSTDLKPSSMLDQLRGKMIKSLNQTGKDEDSQDGMDISLIVINKDTKELSYAGANLPIFLVTNNQLPSNDRITVHDKLIELRADRMPISYYQRMTNFTEINLKLSENDTIYLFSDGYVDQFGGPNNKKLGYSAFRNLIQSVVNEPIEKQKSKIWSVFEQWKGGENQTDDVLVFGIKI